jgi:hypothetical protein
MGQSIIKNIKRVFAQNGGSGGGGVTGSGTTNYIPKWTPDGFTLGNSQIRDNGTSVGIAKNPINAARLEIDGSTTLQGVYITTSGNIGINAVETSGIANKSEVTTGTAFRANLTNLSAVGIDIEYTPTSSKRLQQLASGHMGVNVLAQATTMFLTKGSDSTSSNNCALFVNSSNAEILKLRNDRAIILDGTALYFDGKFSINNFSPTATIDIIHPNTVAHPLRLVSNHLTLTRAVLLNNGAVATDFRIGNSGGSFYFGVDGTAKGYLDNYTGQQFDYKISGTPKLTIDTSGNLGINTLTPTSKLHVVGLVEYADNAAALAGGLTVGAMYIRTGHGLDIVV